MYVCAHVCTCVFVREDLRVHVFPHVILIRTHFFNHISCTFAALTFLRLVLTRPTRQPRGRGKRVSAEQKPLQCVGVLKDGLLVIYKYLYSVKFHLLFVCNVSKYIFLHELLQSSGHILNNSVFRLVPKIYFNLVHRCKLSFFFKVCLCPFFFFKLASKQKLCIRFHHQIQF